MAIQKLRVEINVNGRDYVRDVEPRYLLADFLRHELGLKDAYRLRARCLRSLHRDDRWPYRAQLSAFCGRRRRCKDHDGRELGQRN